MDQSKFENNEETAIDATVIQPANKSQIAHKMSHQFDKDGNIDNKYYNGTQIQIKAFTRNAKNGHKSSLSIVDSLGLRITGLDQHQNEKKELIELIEKRYKETRDIGPKTENMFKTERKLYIQDLYSYENKKRVDEIASHIKTKDPKIDLYSMDISLKILCICSGVVMDNPLVNMERKDGLHNVHLKVILYTLFGIQVTPHQMRKYTTHFKRLYRWYSLTIEDQKIIQQRDEKNTSYTHWKNLCKSSEISGNAFVMLEDNDWMKIIKKIHALRIVPTLPPSNKRKNPSNVNSKKRKLIKHKDTPSDVNPLKKHKKNNHNSNNNNNNNNAIALEHDHENNKNNNKLIENNSNRSSTEETSFATALTPFNLTDPDLREFSNNLILSPKQSLNTRGLWSGSLGIYAAIIKCCSMKSEFDVEITQWLPHVPRTHLKIHCKNVEFDEKLIVDLLTQDIREQLNLPSNEDLIENIHFEPIEADKTVECILTYPQTFRENLLNPICIKLKPPYSSTALILHKCIPTAVTKLNNSLCQSMIINKNKSKKEQLNLSYKQKSFEEIESNIKLINQIKNKITKIELFQHYMIEFGSSIPEPDEKMNNEQKNEYWRNKYEEAPENIKQFTQAIKENDDKQKNESYILSTLEIFNLNMNTYNELLDNVEEHQNRKHIVVNELEITEYCVKTTSYKCTSCGKNVKCKKNEQFVLLINSLCKACRKKTFKDKRNKSLSEINENEFGIHACAVLWYPSHNKSPETFECAEIFSKFTEIEFKSKNNNNNNNDKKTNHCVGLAFVDSVYPLKITINDKKSLNTLKNIKIITHM